MSYIFSHKLLALNSDFNGHNYINFFSKRVQEVNVIMHRSQQREDETKHFKEINFMLLPFDSHRKAHQKPIPVHYKYTESMFNLIQMHSF